MLTDVLVNPVAVARLRKGPAGPHLDKYVGWLLDQGYSHETIRAYVPASADFMTWARSGGYEVEVIDQGVLDAYRKHLLSEGRWQDHLGGSCNYYTGARSLVAFFRDSGLSPKQSIPEIEQVREFRFWLLQHRGLKESTCRVYTSVVTEFVEILGTDTEQYHAAAIRAFVLDKAKRLSTSGAKNVVTAIRNYLRFLIAVGECSVGLDDAVPRIAGWRLSSLPRYMEPDDVERVISACDPSTAVGARDRAILLLLARLALRAGDVAGLRLTDINWQEGRLLVAGKGRREAWLPLPQDVGDAILSYLDGMRPKVAVEAVFVSKSAPHRAVASHTVSHIAQRAIKRSGVETPFSGAHVFRHSAATAMLRRGVPLRDIGTLLRHESVESTALYAKVDIELLKTVARPWPGRSSC